MSTRKALVFSFADRHSGLVIHMATAIVIARLLTPGDIGVYSIAMVLVTFVSNFRDLGAGQYLVQKRQITQDDLRAVWAVQLYVGLILASVVAVASFPAAAIYREPRMIGILWVVALNFAITPVMGYQYAWLVREMRFGALASIRFSSAIATSIVAIGLAWKEVGPISLAWGNLAGTIAGIAVFALLDYSKLPWRPKISRVKEVITFGGMMTLLTLIRSINYGMAEMFLGRLQGMHDTGLYSRARGIVSVFDDIVTAAVNTVAMPYFAKELRLGRDVKGPFLHASALVTVLGWSFYGSLAVLAYPTIRLLYGDQWDDAVDPARWLAIGSLFLVTSSVCLGPLLALGALTPLVRVSLVVFGVEAVMAGFGAYLGLLMLTKILIIVCAIQMTLWLRLGHRFVGFEWSDLFRTYRGSAIVAIATTSIPLVTMLYFGWRSPSIVLSLSIAVPGGLAAFLAASWAVKHPIWSEIVNALRAIRER
ncbi:MAG TPA: oligosaccharide flippase family protein [Casimicrobiaceae bacterium]|nr:oligosaccharide flippase family protein [Casimicrobiaceae bacterium]